MKQMVEVERALYVHRNQNTRPSADQIVDALNNIRYDDELKGKRLHDFRVRFVSGTSNYSIDTLLATFTYEEEVSDV